MEITINTRKMGLLIFSKPGKSYVFCDMGDSSKPGTLGDQICHGGDLIGSTITYHGNDYVEFEKLCRRWWTAYLKNERQ